MSFMSQFGAPPRSPTSSSTPAAPRPEVHSSAAAQAYTAPPQDSPNPPRTRAERPTSRPLSMVQTYHPPLMEVAQDTLPELQPIFTFLNSHSNKLYQEGYFLKLNDLDSHGRPNTDRSWTECFAQLVGTVLSLWDAAALDAAGQDGEVVPTFINLTDASIKMIETLPTRAKDVQPLQNVLSISTAGKNRYLLHFNSLHSLTQWTAGIRLAMFEHATLQELYTGSLIAGKGKALNNIKGIMERSKFKTEDWCRVRFGAGTPWRRCWCTISPPDEKEVQKQQKHVRKKSSAYDRSPPPPLKGDIKFYDVKRAKKTQPIATITDAYSAYAIYPQSKPLIDQSTLVKVEGTITIHSQPASTTEGFVFVMPEVHPAVSGFEMMLRWLFPVFDVFALYGRPTKLIADTLDLRGLMFAMPQERRYGYLEILDVAGLIHTDGSHRWREADWRLKMKELTAKRISAMTSSRRLSGSNRRGARSSLNLPSRSTALQFDDSASTRSSPIRHDRTSSSNDVPMYGPPLHTGSAPPTGGPFVPPHHQRSVSEAQGLDRYSARPELSDEPPPPPPPHSSLAQYGDQSTDNVSNDSIETRQGKGSFESDPRRRIAPNGAAEDLPPSLTPEPVIAPPAFARRTSSNALPRPYHSPELRRANSRMSTDTLSQLAGANGMPGVQSGATGSLQRYEATGAPDSRTGDESLMMAHNHERGGSREDTLADRSQSGAYPQRNAQEMYAGTGAGYHELPASASASSLTDRPLPPPPPEFLAGQQGSSSYSDLASSIPVEAGSYRAPPRSHDLPPLPRSSFDSSQNPYNDTPSRYDTMPHSMSQRPDSGDQSRARPRQLPSQGSEEYVPARQSWDQRDAGSSQLPQANGSVMRGSSAYPPRTSSSIPRKPLPHRPSSSRSNNREHPQEDASLDSLRNHVYDQDALDQVIARSPTHSSEKDDLNVQRHPTNNSSHYDTESDASPDYASTRKSTETKRSTTSVEKPRAGVMRTVGTVEPEAKEVMIGDVRYRPDAAKASAPNPDIPDIDFGPTMNYASESPNRPGSSGVLVRGHPTRSKSTDTTTQFKRSSTPSPQPSSPSGHDSRPHSRSPSRLLMEQGIEHVRSGSSGSEAEGRRSMIWQPGMAAHPAHARPSSRQSLTPEQFVQQRAQQARVTPVFAHQRLPSNSMLRSNTPPIARHGSGDHSPQSHGRTPSGESIPRPQSRGGSVAFLPGPSQTQGEDYAAHLSAREQEHVARVTGSPLLNVAGNNNPRPQQPPSGGLIGAIEAREREKKDMKAGLSGKMVHNAIMQRRQQESQVHHYGQPYQGQTMPNYGQMQEPMGHPQQMQWMNSMGDEMLRRQSQLLSLQQQQYSPQLGQHVGSAYAMQPQYSPAASPYSSPQAQPQPQQQRWSPQIGRMPGGWETPGHNSQYGPPQQQPYGPYFGNGQPGRGN
ncbi:MAG: hypothetical protein M1817_005045 [Caeruleum heppii]|nr:MAG: hypothetical protein M1817_005045 [Caeruleum heppii]